MIDDRRTRSKRTAALGALVAGVALFGPLGTTAAEAHGLVGPTDLPIPQWLFAWVAAVVLIASFVALSALWPRPRLASARAVKVLELPRWCEPAAGAFAF